MKRLLALLMCFVCALSLLNGCAAKPSETIPEETKLPTNIMQKEDPSKDGILNILMIGNSYCSYYTDELVAMAAASGITMRVSNVYYSGCPISQHYKWWKNGESNYEFVTHDENGRTQEDGTNLKYCLQQANWDAISLQTGVADRLNKTPTETLNNTRQMRKELWDYIKTNFPLSQYYWHQTWTYQLGANRYGVLWTDPSQQIEKDKEIAEIAAGVCKEDGLICVPTGAAWQKVRNGGYDNLCARLAVNNGEGDYSHDGDIGGGQYLNACVWFEVITGQSCLGNAWRPTYTHNGITHSLPEDLIATLQQAAHDAVAETHSAK